MLRVLQVVLALLIAMFALTFIPFLFGKRAPADGKGERFGDQVHAHLRAGDPAPYYNTDPPTSGPHQPERAAWGAHDPAPPDTLLVHNLEDGGVILWYRPRSPEENDATVNGLKEAAEGYRDVVIAPRDTLETPFALTAWTRLERLDTLDVARIRASLEAYEGVDHHLRGAS